LLRLRAAKHAGNTAVRVVFQYFGVNSALAAAAAQAKCAPALVKPGAEVREYSDRDRAKTAVGCAGEGFMDELVSVSAWC
jgi:hypothetical protein